MPTPSAAANQPLNRTAPAYGSELERRAAEVRREKAQRARFTAQQKAEAAALDERDCRERLRAH